MKKTIIENKYHKVLAISQRARQLQKGARALVQLSGARFTRIAFEEVDRGLISYDTGNAADKD